MAKHIKQSVLPIYLVGGVWLTWGMFFSLHRVTDYAICAAVSAAAFAVGKTLFPDKAYSMPGEPEDKKEEQNKKDEKKEEKPKTTGNPELDKLMAERDRALSEMRRLNDAIEDEKISEQIGHLERVTRKIIDYVVEHPKKLTQIRKFMNYYLPTTLKLLNAYDRMDDTGISGDNITGTKQRVEQMMDTIVKAYDKQLDALYGEEALDISTDITVLENLLAQEGLAGINIHDTAPKEERKQDNGGITLEL